MAISMTAPKLGITMTTGVVSTWVLENGAEVAKGDVVYSDLRRDALAWQLNKIR